MVTLPVPSLCLTLLPEGVYTTAQVLREIFDHTKDLSDLDMAIRMQTQAIDIPLCPNLIEYVQFLSQLYALRYLHSEESRDLEKAVLSARRALDLAEDDYPERAQLASHLVKLYLDMHQKTNNEGYLEKATALNKQVLELSASDLQVLNNHVEALLDLYLSTRDTSYLALALSTTLDTVDPFSTPTASSVPSISPSLIAARHLTTAPSSLFEKYQRTGDLASLNQAIDLLSRTEEQIATACPSQTELRSLLLSDLGNYIQTRFHRAGQVEDLERSLIVFGEAVHNLDENHLFFPSLLNNYSNSFHLRFQRTGSLEDLNRAMLHMRKAIARTPEVFEHELPARLNNLGIYLQTAYERTGDEALAQEGIASQEKAVSMTEETNPALPLRLMGLSNALHAVAQRTEDLDTVKRAIENGERAIALFENMDGHPTIQSSLYNTAQCYRSLSNIDPEARLTALERAVSLFRSSISYTPRTSALYPMRMIALGGTLKTLYKRSPEGQLDTLREAMQCYQQAATAPAGAPASLLGAARKWIKIAERLEDAESTISAYDTTIRLISVVAGLEQTIEARHSSLATVSGLALQAAARGLELDRPDKALEWLEQGRCLVWRQLNNLRTPVDTLRLYDENLANRVVEVSQALEKAGVQSQANVDSHDAYRLASLARQWSELLTEVRAIPGFQTFLKPPSCDDLLEHLPEDGPVVVLNVHEWRCDAIALIRGCEPLHIPLPGMTLAKAEELRQRLQGQILALTSRGAVERMWKEVVGQEMTSEEPRSISPEPMEEDAEGKANGPAETETNTKADQEPVSPEVLASRAMKRLRKKRKSTHPADDVIHTILEELWIHLVEPILSGLGFSVSGLQLTSQSVSS